jgi:hypothetical protein
VTVIEPAAEFARLNKLRWAGRLAALRNSAWIFGVTAVLITLLVFLIPALTGAGKITVEYIVVGTLAGLVGYGELVSRYQDNPGRLYGASPTPIYIIVNIVAGMAALKIIQATGVLSGKSPVWLYQMLLASFGAIAFFRTSLFTVRVGNSDVGIGPSALLQALLTAADRMLDRDQAEGRAEDVASIMRVVDYTKARAALPTLCLILVQSLTQADQESLGRQIDSLDKRNDVDAEAKSIILGVYLIRVVGADVLERSVTALAPYITRTPVP